MADVVAVLDGRDVDDLHRGLKLFDGDVREPDVGDLPGVLHLRKGVDGLLEVGVRVGTVELVQVDRVGPEPVEATQHLIPQEVRVAVGSHSPSRLRSRPAFEATTTSSGSPSACR